VDVQNILTQLREKRDGMDRVILALEHMAAATAGKRPGRPPKWLTAARTGDSPAAAPPVAKRRGRPPGKKKTAE